MDKYGHAKKVCLEKSISFRSNLFIYTYIFELKRGNW